MRELVSVSLPPWLKKRLDQAAKKERMNLSDIVRDALQRYFAIQDFRKLRQEIIPEAEAKGIFTDEDVFRIVS